MATEKSLKRLIFLYTGKAKRLREELADTIARKKEAEGQLRDLKWETKNNKKKPAKKVAKVMGEAPKQRELGRRGDKA